MNGTAQGKWATLAAERRAVQGLLPRVAWPTIVLGIGLPFSYAALILAGLDGALPLWLCAILQGPLAYAHYMLVHEALHHNLRPRGASMPMLEGLFGRVGAAVLLSNWPYARRSHLAHHMHVNDAGDPDLFVKGSFPRLLATWVRLSLLPLIPPAVMSMARPTMTKRVRALLSRSEWAEANIAQSLQAALFVIGAVTGHFWEWLALWFVPARIGSLLLMILFQWLPHHPHEDASRYGNGRLSFWPGAEALLLWQNLHLMHHLWPRVPFYQLGRLYRAIRPELQANRVRHEGLIPGRAPASRHR